MKPWFKHFIGVLGALPGAYLLFITGFFIWMLAHLAHGKDAGPHLPLGQLFAANVLLTLVLLVFHYLWLILGSSFTLERKILWAVGLTFAAPVMMPLLYWLYLRKLPASPYFLGKPLNLISWPSRNREA